MQDKEITKQALERLEKFLEKEHDTLTARNSKSFVNSFTSYIQEVNNHPKSPWKNDGKDPVAGLKALGVKHLSKNQVKLIYMYHSYFKKNKPAYHKLSTIATKLGVKSNTTSDIISRMVDKGILLKIHWYMGSKVSGRRLMLLPNIPGATEEGTDLLREHLKDIGYRDKYIKIWNFLDENDEEKDVETSTDSNKKNKTGQTDVNLTLIGNTLEVQEFLSLLIYKHTVLFYNNIIYNRIKENIELKFNIRKEKKQGLKVNEKAYAFNEGLRPSSTDFKNKSSKQRKYFGSVKKQKGCMRADALDGPCPSTIHSGVNPVVQESVLGNDNTIKNSVSKEKSSPAGESVPHKLCFNKDKQHKSLSTSRKVVSTKTSVQSLNPCLNKGNTASINNPDSKYSFSCPTKDFFLVPEEKKKLSDILSFLNKQKPSKRVVDRQTLNFLNFCSKHLYGNDFKIGNLLRGYAQTNKFYGKTQNALFMKYLEVMLKGNALAFEETETILNYYNSINVPGFSKIRNNPKTKSYKHLVIAVTYWLQKYSVEAICKGADFLVNFKEDDLGVAYCNSLLMFLIAPQGRAKMNAYFCNDSEAVFRNILFDKADAHEEHHQKAKEVYVSCFQNYERGERYHLENRAALRAFLRLIINLKIKEGRNLCGHRFAFPGINGEEPLLQMFFRHISQFNSYGIPFVQDMDYNNWVSFAYQKMQKEYGYVDFWRRSKKVID